MFHVKNSFLRDGTYKEVTVIKSQKDPQTGIDGRKDGIMFGYLGNRRIAKYRMIDIDFNYNYYLTYNCNEATFNGQTKHDENIFVETRQRHPGQDLFNRIDLKMKKMGLERFLPYLHKDNQANCEFVEGDNQE